MVGNDDNRGPDNHAVDALLSPFGQKNNSQLAMGAVKAGSDRQESIDNHTAMT